MRMEDVVGLMKMVVQTGRMVEQCKVVVKNTLKRSYRKTLRFDK